MNEARVRSGSQGGWITSLAIVSLGMPLVVASVGQGATAGSTDYRATVAGLVIGLAAGIVALFGSRALTPTWYRWLLVGITSLGMLISAYILWLLVGLCGLPVLWGICRP